MFYKILFKLYLIHSISLKKKISIKYIENVQQLHTLDLIFQNMYNQRLSFYLSALSFIGFIIDYIFY